MRVVHVITRLIVGGAQENVIASVLGLARKPGVEVELISGSSHGPEGSLESVFSAKPELLAIVPELVRPVHPWKDYRALVRLTARFRGARPDIVHTHSGKAGILGRLAAARAGVPVIIHTIHGPSFGPFQGRIPNLLFRSAERYASRVTTHFVVVAEAMTEQYLAAGIGTRERYTKVLSGFPLEPFLTVRNDLGVRAKLGLKPEHIVVGKLARLFKLKGHDDIFAIAPALVHECPQMRFLFVGGGEWRGRFEARARALGLGEHFVFTGLVPPEAVPQLVGIMDIVAHLSHREGLARALPQALAAGRPVVAYDCDGAREVCLDNQTGFLLPPGDLDGVRKRVGQLAADAGLRARLGQYGREFVRERFGAQRMVDALHQLYLRLAPSAASEVRAEICRN